MKRIKILSLIIALLIILTGCSKNEDIIAKVNGKDINISDFEKDYYMYARNEIKNNGEGFLDKEENGKTNREKLIDKRLDVFIRDEIFLQDMERKNIKITKEEKQKAIIEEKNKIDDRFEDFLTLSGLSEEDFIEIFVIKPLKLQKYTDEILKEMPVDEKMVKDYYEENLDYLTEINAKHILVDSEELAKEVLGKYNNGEDFYYLAKDYSTDELTKYIEGSLGYFIRDEIPKDFADAIFDLELGKISDPIKTKQGYHIVIVNDKRPKPFKEAEPLIDEMLRTEAFEKYIKELVEDAKVEIFKENFKVDKEKEELIEIIRD